MTKVPDDRRILEILRRGGYELSDEWAWIRHYLELADKCLKPDDKAPPAPENIPDNNSHTGDDQQPTTGPDSPADGGDVEAAKTESRPQARKQSA